MASGLLLALAGSIAFSGKAIIVKLAYATAWTRSRSSCTACCSHCPSLP